MDLAVVLARFEEHMLHGDIDEIPAAEQFDDPPLQQQRRHKYGDEAEDEGADQAIGKRLLLLLLRQPFGEQPQNEGVVDRERPFKQDQQSDNGEIAPGNGLTVKIEVGENHEHLLTGSFPKSFRRSESAIIPARPSRGSPTRQAATGRRF